MEMEGGQILVTPRAMSEPALSNSPVIPQGIALICALCAVLVLGCAELGSSTSIRHRAHQSNEFFPRPPNAPITEGRLQRP